MKNAQREAGLGDEEYRDAVEHLSAIRGCRSSTDPRLTDDHMDHLLAYFEAIFWRKVDTENWLVQCPCKRIAVFRERGYWARKNPKGATSRDRYSETQLRREIEGLHDDLAKLGYGFGYFQAIENKIQPFSLVAYAVALRRTVASKRSKQPAAPLQAASLI